MTRYKSFAWMSPQSKGDNKPTASPDADLKIKDDATGEASLTTKGLKLQTSNPDLLVTYNR